MKKLAIFVEGYTEQLFVEKLVPAIAGANYASIKTFVASGGRKVGTRKLAVVNATKDSGAEQYYVMIVNSGTDGRVASDIRDQYDGLVQGGYSAIVAIRDVYPLPRAELNRLRANLGYGIKTKPLSPVFILSIMEQEAWFLSEHTHFERINAALTPARIMADLGIDVRNDDMQLRDSPAKDLKAIYSLEGLGYGKTLSHIQRTVNALSMEALYIDVRTRNPDMNRLFSELDLFFTKIAP